MASKTYSIETITPQDASRILEASTFRNRDVAQGKVDSYSRDMVSQSWALNGESIKIGEDGTSLYDGQHRLRAVVQSGIPLTTFVARGFTLEEAMTMDRGRARSAGNVFQMNDEKNYNELATLMKHWLAYSNGRYGMVFAKNRNSTSPTAPECWSAFQEDPEAFRWAAAHWSRLRKRRGTAGWSGVGSGAPALALAVFYKIDRDAAEDFVSNIYSILEYSPTTDRVAPIVSLVKAMNRLKEGKGSPAQQEHRDQPGLTLYYFFTAWNMYTDGSSAHNIAAPKFSSDVPSPRSSLV